MFSIQIIDSDAFLDMPLSTQALYFHLNMRADDDGFVGNPKRIKSLIGATDDDLKLLIAKRFVLIFEDGVIVIKHWRMHNTIQKDRYTQTAYIDELNQLQIKENKAYTLPNQQCFQNVSKMEPKCFQNVSTGLGLDIALDLDLDKEKDIYVQSDCITHEPEPTKEAVINLTLNDKSEYPIYQSQIDEWSELYQNVDILKQLKKMKGWLNANPTRRKTKRGILKFVNAWLSREQDNPHYEKSNQKESKEESFNITKFDV